MFKFYLKLIRIWDNHFRKDHCLELFFGVNSELIDSFLIGLGGVSIVCKDDFEIFFENKSAVRFFVIGERSSKRLFPLRELICCGVTDLNLI